MSDGLKNGRLPRFDERRDGPSSWLIKKKTENLARPGLG